MWIEAEKIFNTARARNEAYKAFMDDLDKSGSYAKVEKLRIEHKDLFERLNNEKEKGYDWYGFDYLDEIEEAITERKALITLHLKRKKEHVY